MTKNARFWNFVFASSLLSIFSFGLGFLAWKSAIGDFPLTGSLAFLNGPEFLMVALAANLKPAIYITLLSWLTAMVLWVYAIERRNQALLSQQIVLVVLIVTFTLLSIFHYLAWLLLIFGMMQR